LIQDILKRNSAYSWNFKRRRKKKNNRTEAVIQFGFIKDAPGHVSFDVKIINEHSKRMGLGKLKKKSIDTDDVSKI
jgi:DNA polymerase-3 subunit epsilon